MLFEREKVEARFRDMPDDVLLDQMGEDLTALEREVALVEARRRGLYLDALRVADRDAPLEVAPGHGPLQVCARYLNPMDAQVLAACLQNEGLSAQLEEEARQQQERSEPLLVTQALELNPTTAPPRAEEGHSPKDARTAVDFALGGPDFGDQEVVDRIVAKTAENAEGSNKTWVEGEEA